jgi:hypothetical protein
MNYKYTLEKCADYFLDLLDAKPGTLPGRAEGHWEDLFIFAEDHGIYHYLAAWIVEFWSANIPIELRENIKRDLEWNTARNTKLSEEIVELSRMFQAERIPVMFLKGAAGLARGIFPIGWRYISDIDILARETDNDKIDQVLRSNGYGHLKSSYYFDHHHQAPYYHKDRISDVEIHFKPYHHCFKNSIVDEMWNSSDTVIFNSEPVTLPSITDHVWILLRKELIRKILYPRFNELFEIDLILNSQYCINFEILLQRSDLESIPEILNKNSHCSSNFLGSSFTGLVDTANFMRFDLESFQLLKLRKPEKSLFMHLKFFLAAVRYLSGSGIKNKSATFFTILRNFSIPELFQLALPWSGINKPSYKRFTRIMRSLFQGEFKYLINKK